MDMKSTPYEALKACIDKAASQSALARDLGVSQPTVWRWLKSSRQMPAEYVLTAERLYGVSRHLLRPDIYPVDLPPFAPNAPTVSMATCEGPCDPHLKLQSGEGDMA